MTDKSDFLADYSTGPNMSPLTMAEYSNDRTVPEMSALSISNTASATDIVTVICEGREFVLTRNKAIAHSTHLAKVFASDFQESTTKTMNHEEFSADVVAHVIDWMDFGGFTLMPEHAEHAESECSGWPIDLPSFGNAVLTFAHVFAAADYFGVEALKYKCAWKMEGFFRDHWVAEGFGAIVRGVYELPRPGFEKLRHTIVQAATEHIGELVKRADFALVLGSDGETLREFAVDLVRSMWDQSWRDQSELKASEIETGKLQAQNTALMGSKAAAETEITELKAVMAQLQQGAVLQGVEWQRRVRQTENEASAEMDGVNKLLRGLHECRNCESDIKVQIERGGKKGDGAYFVRCTKCKCKHE